MVLNEMSKEREKLISARVAAEVEARLSNFNAKTKGQAALSAALYDLTGSIDVAAIYSTVATRIDDILNTKDYAGVLAVYNHKGLVPCAGGFFRFEGNEFEDYLERLVTNKKGQPVIEAMRNATPVVGV